MPVSKKATPLLIRAAELLEEEAECLRQSCTSNGEWPDDESPESAARADYDEMVDVAIQLRALHKNIPRVVRQA